MAKRNFSWRRSRVSGRSVVVKKLFHREGGDYLFNAGLVRAGLVLARHGRASAGDAESTAVAAASLAGERTRVLVAACSAVLVAVRVASRLRSLRRFPACRMANARASAACNCGRIFAARSSGSPSDLRFVRACGRRTRCAAQIATKRSRFSIGSKRRRADRAGRSRSIRKKFARCGSAFRKEISAAQRSLCNQSNSSATSSAASTARKIFHALLG